MKKQVLFIAITLFSLSSLFGQNYYHQWHQQLNHVTITETTQDANGNLYHIGHYSLSPDLEPGPNSNSYTVNGQNDFFVQKTDDLGNLIWVKTFGGSGQDYADGIAVDNLGYVYITGSFSDTVDFDPATNSTFNFVSNGGTDIFILKLNSSGDFVWVKTMGDSEYDEGNSIDIDNSNNVYITGTFKDSVYFDQLNGAQLQIATIYNPFILKLSSGGNFTWVKTLNCTSYSYGERIKIDNNSNVITMGKFQGTIDLDPSAATTNASSTGFYDLYTLKLDVNGNYVWSSNIGSSGDEYAYDIEIDGDDNVYFLGGFNGTIDFDPSSNTYNLTNSVIYQGFIQKTMADGSWNWTRSIDGCKAKRLSVYEDKLMFNGLFSGTVDFDFGTGTDIKTSTGGDDIYCAKVDTAGNYEQSFIMGNSNSDDVYEINAFTDSSFILYGFFQSSSVEGNPAGNSVPINYSNGGSIFFAKYQTCYPNYSTVAESACESYTSPSGNYTWTSSGTYADTLLNSNGCDSVITINLTINNSTTTIDNQSACGSFTWIDGNTYTSNNNTATYTTATTAGCDSIITLNLTILSSSTSTDTQTACGSFIWLDGNTYTSNNNTATYITTNAAGCDSIITLDLTILSSSSSMDTQTACGSFTWMDGNTYTSSNNTATYTTSNAAGCDSIITLDLTIHSVDTSVTQSGQTLTSNVSGAQYQWIDCDNSTAIPGETNVSFTPSASGNYAVVVTTPEGCVDTSSCYAISFASIDELLTDVRIYPQPFQNELNLRFESNGKRSIIMYDIKGKEVLTLQTSEETLKINTTEFIEGFYLLKIISGNSANSYTVIKH